MQYGCEPRQPDTDCTLVLIGQFDCAFGAPVSDNAVWETVLINVVEASLLFTEMEPPAIEIPTAPLV